MHVTTTNKQTIANLLEDGDFEPYAHSSEDANTVNQFYCGKKFAV